MIRLVTLVVVCLLPAVSQAGPLADLLATRGIERNTRLLNAATENVQAKARFQQASCGSYVVPTRTYVQPASWGSWGSSQGQSLADALLMKLIGNAIEEGIQRHRDEHEWVRQQMDAQTQAINSLRDTIQLQMQLQAVQRAQTPQQTAPPDDAAIQNSIKIKPQPASRKDKVTSFIRQRQRQLIQRAKVQLSR